MTKYIVITGSTSGIGQELVKVFARDLGNLVFAGYRNKEKLPKNQPVNVINFYIDMSDRYSIFKASEFIKTKTKKIDTIINVAGNVVAGPIEKIDIQRLKDQFDVNTFSHLELTQNLIELMNNGKIINVSSMASFGQFPFISPYCASKRALDIFFNALALENHRNIKVISVKPGVIATPIWEKSVDDNLKYLEKYSGYEKELEYLKHNALKNTKTGLKVEKVAEFIQKIEAREYNLSSYTIGKDAFLAELLSILPQDVINYIVTHFMRKRLQEFYNPEKKQKK